MGANTSSEVGGEWFQYSNNHAAWDSRAWREYLLASAEDLRTVLSQPAPHDFPGIEAKIEHLLSQIESQTASNPISWDMNYSVLSRLGSRFGLAFNTSREVPFLALSIRCMNRALGLAPTDHWMAIPTLECISQAHLVRYRELNDSSDISAAVECYARALSLGHNNFLDIAEPLDNFAKTHFNRFKSQGSVDELENTIYCFVSALSITPEIHETSLELFHNLGVSYSARFARLGDLKDIETALEYQVRAVGLTPDGTPGLPNRLNSLATCYGARFDRLGDLHDMEKVIEYMTRAVEITPEDDPNLPSRLHNLCNSYSLRFERFGNLDDLSKALEYETLAIDIISDSDPELPVLLRKLGNLYSDRFERLGDLADIEKAIKFKSRATELAQNDHPLLAALLANLGSSYAARFERSGDLFDLKLAIEHQTRAIEIIPVDHPNLPSLFNSLGISHSILFDRLDTLQDLEKALESFKRAVELTPSGHPDSPARLTNLGGLYRIRFERLGQLDDLDESVSSSTRAFSLAPDGDPHIPTMLDHLGKSHSSRFGRLGSLDDMDKAVEYMARAVSLTPENDPKLPQKIHNLCIAYRARFARLGDKTDINKAIAHQVHAVGLVPEDHPQLPVWLNSLGHSYGTRFDRFESLDDLQKATEHHIRAAELTPDGHSHLAMYLNNVGNSHLAHFNVSANPEDMDKAIQQKSRALDLTPDDHPDKAIRFSSLGSALGRRFEHSRNPKDLDEAIEKATHAVKLTPEGGQDLSDLFSSLGKLYRLRYMDLGFQEALNDSIQFYKKSSQCTGGYPKTKILAARNWARLSSHARSPDALEAYRTALDLLPKLAWIGSKVNRRYDELRLMNNLAAEAAAAAISAQELSLALEWLEQARSVVWNQTLQLRTPLERLELAHPSLANRIQYVASQLYGSEREGQTPITEEIDLEKAAQQRRKLAQEYDQLTEQAHQLAGFEDMLRPKKASEFIPVARTGPVVVLICHPHHSDALILLPGQSEITHVPLPEFKYDTAQNLRMVIEQSLRSHGIRTRIKFRRRIEGEHKDGFEHALAILWTDLVKPVLGHLGYMRAPTPSELPHITWCATGVTSFLPLHAAGIYDQPKAKLSDFAISSYTPTLTSLLLPASRPIIENPGILAVGQKSTPGMNPLPGTVDELDKIRMYAQRGIKYTRLSDQEATISSVLDAMDRHDSVHFACHAHQNVHDPAASGFFLHDGVLDIATIRNKIFAGKGLAFLSACQTATGDKDLPDEAVHLASGLLMAGYPSVIATMWSVMDDDAPFIADKIYGQLMEDGRLNVRAAPKALHNAVAELRERVGDKAFARWIPYIHFGA